MTEQDTREILTELEYSTLPKKTRETLVELVMRNMTRAPKDVSDDGIERYTCRICKNFYHGGANFCSECGQRLREEGPEE